MGSPVEALAADVRPPTEGDVFLVDVGRDVTSTPVDISAFKGRYITVQNSGANPLAILFGDANTVADPAAVAGANRCMVLAPNEQRDYRYDEGLTFVRGTERILVTHLVYRAVTATTDVRATVS